MDNTQEVSIKFINTITGDKKLQEYEKRLENIYSYISSIQTGQSQAVKEVKNAVANLGGETEKAKDKTVKFKNVLKTAFNIGGITGAIVATKKLIKTFADLAQKSSDYIENLNLLEVAYANTTKVAGKFNESIDQSSARIEKFIDKMADVYGLDENNLTRKFGIFKQLANAMKLPTETAENLSEIMVKMTNDIASLYNLDLDRASNALQSALAGQVRPIRTATGADITEKTLQNTVDALGLDRTINQLSYVEKRLIMVISLTDQLKKSQGDYARTIESVANQTRIMKEQWERLSRAIGNVFYPMLEKVLPYLNAILMVLTEIFNLVASLLGFELPEFDYSGLAGASDATLALEEEMNGASSSVDNLSKKLSGLRGFDKLNVITTPKGQSSTAGSGIDPKILEAFNDAFENYDDMLNEVSMKARKIRDAILDWLGFTDGSYKNLKLIGAVLGTILGLKLLKGITGIINGTSGLGKLLGNTGLFKTVKNLLSPLKNLGKLFKDDLAGGVTGLGKAMGNSIDMWSKTLTAMDRVKISLIGGAGVIASLTLLKQSMKNVSDEGWNLKNALEAGIGVLGTTASGALLGSQFGALGAVIGGVTGALVGLYTAYMEYPTYVSKMVDEVKKTNIEIEKYNSNLTAQYDAIKQTAIENDALQSSYASLVSELENIVDENGKVKSGYEDRVNFIITTLSDAYGIELKLVDGIIEGYDTQIQKIKDVIFEKRKEIALQNAEEGYKVAIKEKVQAYENYTKAVENNAKAIDAQKEAQEKYNKAYDDWMLRTAGGMKINTGADVALKKARNQLTDANKALEDSKTTLDNATEAYDKNTRAIMTYEGLLSSDTKENAELVEKYIKDIENSYYDGTKYIQLSHEEQVKDALLYYSSVLRITNENEGKITEKTMSEANARLNSLKTTLSDMTNTLKGNMGKEVVDAWVALASTSEDGFIDEFSKLNTDIQEEIINKMYESGYNISDELQRGIKQINPTIKVKTDLSEANKTIKITADTSSAEKSTSTFWDRLRSAFSSTLGFTLGALKFADGGMPQVGQMFIANEKGPELVGQIGGQSFVANQNQMIDLLDKKIGNAQGGINNATFIVQVGDEKVANVVLNNLSEIAKTNGKPIKIGG